MAVVTIRQLLDSGVHFGHQTRRWNPKVKRFILTERSGIHIIDLQQSLTYIDRAYDFVKETVARGGTVLFVGTKKQAQESIAEQATRVGQPYVNQRWLGGLLTNFQTVAKRLNRLKELDLVDFDDTSKGYTKKELLIQRRERDKLEKTLGGIRNLTKTPSAMWVIDSKREHLAVDEAKKLGIPVIGILDTNADPDELAYPIPGNDDAIRSVALLTRIIADAGRGPDPAPPGHEPGRRRAARRVGAGAPPGDREPGGAVAAGRAGRRPGHRPDRRHAGPHRHRRRGPGRRERRRRGCDRRRRPRRADRGERRGRAGGRRPRRGDRRGPRAGARTADRGRRRGRGAREVDPGPAPPGEGHRPGRDRGPRALRLSPSTTSGRPSEQRHPRRPGGPAVRQNTKGVSHGRIQRR